MTWEVKDIRVSASKTATAYKTAAAWAAMASTDCDRCVHMCNASCAGFLVKNAPCTIVATGNVGAIIARGAGGMVDAVDTEQPWVLRFQSCVNTMLACNDDDLVVGVIDAPPPEHAHEAFAQLQASSENIRTIDLHPNKLLILNGPDTKLYPRWSLADEETADLPRLMTYTAHMWESICTRTAWGCVVHSTEGSERMVVPLSRILGSHQVGRPEQLLMPFPPGYSCPPEAMHLLTHSNNVQSGSIRCSSTRGIVLQPTDFEDVVVTAVLQNDTGNAKTEIDDEMMLLRQMLTSNRPAEVGAACFELEAKNSQNAIVRRATNIVMRARKANAWASIAEPPPLLRQASAAPLHSQCR